MEEFKILKAWSTTTRVMWRPHPCLWAGLVPDISWAEIAELIRERTKLASEIWHAAANVSKSYETIPTSVAHGDFSSFLPVWVCATNFECNHHVPGQSICCSRTPMTVRNINAIPRRPVLAFPTWCVFCESQRSLLSLTTCYACWENRSLAFASCVCT